EARYSDYVEAMRDLERVKARARGVLAQAEANLKSRRASYELEEERLEKVRKMIENSVIRAPKPGRVVYASTSNPWARRNAAIREGVKLWQNQEILRIPDLSTLAAVISIHETDVQKVKVGQRAAVSVEAMPGKTFAGTVESISPVASSAHAWLNPEVKVYETEVKLNEQAEGLTPGMSASAEVVIAELKEVLHVPIGAVTTYRGRRVCLVKNPDGQQVRLVKTGYFTEKFVEIQEGLSEGQLVYLEPAELLGAEAWQEPEPQPTRGSAAPPAEEEAAAGEAPAEGEPAPEQSGPPAGGQAAAPEPEQAEPAQDMESLDWQELGRQMQGLSPAERQKKWEEILQKLSPEQRKALQERARQWQPGGPEAAPSPAEPTGKAETDGREQ
ncbi:MAG: efflux RND transporter periplasmic adaptor subunit, partial [Planctomycetota bacterium]